ncbi:MULTISPECIES: hypothetical protein [unclassified Flavobacterium]|uniref:hypothetical protein n=1 Tax=unclassified Flavobacterium TaxID=196869 RepID=UPI001F141CD1|nr:MULTISPECIES: hypothetical protein [unclassified Flavobacterium]UMY64851.1 hypothetical protein MKO97_10040 [Flavobacterium sp. HJ-32-4]
MAKQKGILKLEGTLEGLNFYYRKGVPVVRTAGGGFNGKTIRSSESMVRVRQNMSEFGRCATLTKVHRHALLQLLAPYKDTSWHVRLMALWQEIKTCDTSSARGERKPGIGFGTPEGRRVFDRFEVTPGSRRGLILAQKGHFDAETFTFSVDHSALDGISFPAHATHATLCLAVLEFDFEVPACRVLQGKPSVLRRGDLPDALTLECDPPAGPSYGVYLVVTFQEEVNGTMAQLKEGVGVYGLTGV